MYVHKLNIQVKVQILLKRLKKYITTRKLSRQIPPQV